MANGQQKRVFLRIPVHIAVDVYLDGQFIKKLKLVDLSSNGLSILIGSSDVLPDRFEIRFRFRRFSPLVRIVLEVKNRISVPQGLRLGCVFAEISERNKRRIDKFVLSFVDISFPEQVVNFGAFFCVLDALFRIVLYSVNSYYSATELGRSQFAPGLSGFTGLALFFYAFFAFLAFILSSPFAVSKGRLSFAISLFLTGYSFLFLLVKNFTCWRAGLWNFRQLFVSGYLGFQLFLFLYSGFAIFTGVIFLKKIALTLGILKQEFTALRFRLSQMKFLRKGKNSK